MFLDQFNVEVSIHDPLSASGLLVVDSTQLFRSHMCESIGSGEACHDLKVQKGHGLSAVETCEALVKRPSA